MTAPTHPVRVVPIPRTFRPTLWLNMRSLSTFVSKKIDRAITLTSPSSRAYDTPPS